MQHRSESRLPAVVAGAALLFCIVSHTPPLAAQETYPSYLPHRVHDAEASAFIDFETLATRAMEADVVFFGELHDDTGAHRLQLALLEALARRDVDVVLSLEMFERDVQPLLDGYLADEVDEATFLEDSRPWPNYEEDYRPLVEFARKMGWPVLAANVPRPLAARVAQEGLAVLDTLEAEARQWIASEMHCPDDAYYDRFEETFREHPFGDASPEETEAMIWRYYEAQCVKDETMAESIAETLDSMPDHVIVHMNGAFHSDFGLGTAARVRERRPDAGTLLLSALPTEDLDWPPIVENEGRAEYLVFTLGDGGR